MVPKIHGDQRGWFHRVYSNKELGGYIPKKIVQINHSFNKNKGTFRGFHFQLPPHNESKLIRCIRGKVLDMALDIRCGSSTFLQVASIELSSEKRNMIYIPEGFAHGFLTLEDNCELEYYHSEEYIKESEGGINVSDPKLNLTLPLNIELISERDKAFNLMNESFIGI